MRRLLGLLLALSPACCSAAVPNPTALKVTTLTVTGFTAVGFNETDWNATTIMQDNLRAVNDLTSSQGSIDSDRIVVLPEYALTTTRVINDSGLALGLAQLVGEPGPNVLPCSSAGQQAEYMLMRGLSCISRNNFVYLVAAVLEKEARNCSTNETAPCFNVFSTTVVTNKDGYFIAKYRRFNSIGASVLRRAATLTPTSFTTASGFTFGLLTGHDLLFREPAQSLLRRNVSYFITNGAWKNTLPFDFSLNVFQGWMEAKRANLAAANYQEAERRYAGIGTYRHFPGGSVRSETASPGSGGYVAIGDSLGDVDSSRRRKRQLGPRGELATEPADLSQFRAAPVPLSRASTRVQACHNDFCCTLDYSTFADLADTTNVSYRLLAFYGNRTVDGEAVFLEQTCGLVACARLSENETDCSAPRQLTSYTDIVSFSSLALQGFFATDSVRPVTMSGKQLRYNSLDPGIFTVQRISERNFTVRYELPRSLFVEVKTFALTATDVPPPPAPPPPPEKNASGLAATSSAVLLLVATAAKLL